MSDHLDATAAVVEAPKPVEPSALDRAAGARILARSFYRELRENGYSPRQLLAISTELIELVTDDLERERKQKGDA